MTHRKELRNAVRACLAHSLNAAKRGRVTENVKAARARLRLILADQDSFTENEIRTELCGFWHFWRTWNN